MLDRPPLSENPAWQQARNDINEFVKISEDIRRYGFEGYIKFRTINDDLNGIAGVLDRQQDETLDKVQNMQLHARRSILLWSVIALIVGAMVAAGTVGSAKTFRKCSAAR